MMHAEVRIYFVDASLDDLLFIAVRIRAQAVLQKGSRARKGEDIQNNSFFVSLIRKEMADLVLANVGDGFGDVFIAGTAFVERGDQLRNALLNIRHVICLVSETDPHSLYFIFLDCIVVHVFNKAIAYADVVNPRKIRLQSRGYDIVL
jgi:hypothetical protein